MEGKIKSKARFNSGKVYKGFPKHIKERLTPDYHHVSLFDDTIKLKIDKKEET